MKKVVFMEFSRYSTEMGAAKMRLNFFKRISFTEFQLKLYIDLFEINREHELLPLSLAGWPFIVALTVHSLN